MKTFLVGLTLAASVALAAPRINAGNWEATMVTDGETRKLTFCLSAEEAAALNADSKSGQEFAAKKAGARCSVKTYEANSDTVSYTLVCGNRTITDVTRYRGDTSEGVKTVTADGKTSETRIKSRRLGACP